VQGSLSPWPLYYTHRGLYTCITNSELRVSVTPQNDASTATHHAVYMDTLKIAHSTIYVSKANIRNSTYELSRNEQFLCTYIAQTNKFRLLIHLTNTEPRACEHFNKLTSSNLTTYLMKKNKLNLRIFNLRTHFKEYIMFIS
jgi:hypothetical protein